MSSGLLIAAPNSASGKTTVTLGLLRALRARGVQVRSAKSGPDYIDPRFHEAATGLPCPNLDAWAMAPDRVRALAAGSGLLLVEGAMGLFDAAGDGRGAAADLARMLGVPVLLVVDAARMSHSIAPLVAGFRDHDPSVRIVGVLLNRVGSPRHEALLRRALAPLALPVVGALPRDPALAMPSRHLGLVQAAEHPALEDFIEHAAELVAAHVDLDAVCALAAPLQAADEATRVPPPGQKIAIAEDAAFSFSYPHLRDDWRVAGAEITTFSPLADEPPPPTDVIILPGGYPELHAGVLAGNARFRSAMQSAAEHTDIYGECGGFMVLGEALTDADGTVHPMLGLLRLATSFATRKLHLGYRVLEPRGGPFAGHLSAHEFHYATTLRAEGAPLFDAWEADGTPLPPMGLRHGRVSGSFAHVIDRRLAPPSAEE